MVDSMTGYLIGQAHKNDPLMVFDWDKAARLIVEHKPDYAGAGLRGDWEYTGGTIYTADGGPVPEEDSYAYLESTWAQPELEIDGMRSECWLYEKDAPWDDSGIYWPESARKILKEGGLIC